MQEPVPRLPELLSDFPAQNVASGNRTLRPAVTF
jgi:hypothetical protein